MSDDLLEYRIRYQGDGGGEWETPEPGATALSGALAIEFRRTPLPSAAALLAYLEAAGWAMSPPEGWSAATLNEPTGEVIVVRESDTPEEAAVKIARAEGRTPAEVMAAIRALQEAPNSHAGAPAADDTGRASVIAQADARPSAGTVPPCGCGRDHFADAERDLIRADLGQLLELLGLGDYARPVSPHEVFQQCIREAARVIDRNGVLGRIIDSASRELRKAGGGG